MTKFQSQNGLTAKTIQQRIGEMMTVGIAPRPAARQATGAERAEIRKLHVSYVQRKPRPGMNFGVEFIFADVRDRLQDDITATVHQAKFYSNGVLRRLLIALDAALHQGDINHVTGDINYAGIALSRKKTILTILDTGFLNNCRGLKKLMLKMLWLKLPALRAAAITTISQTSKAEILQHLPLDPHTIRVIPVAVSPDFVYSPSVFNSQCPRILHIGTKPNKNLLRLVRALSGMACCLNIIGPLSDDIRSELKASSLPFENHVNLSLPEVIQQYRRSDLLAFCSTYEGFGMPIVEANATGRPVVTSNIAAMPEVAGQAACLVDPFDESSIRAGIERVVHDREYRAMLIDSGRINALRFDGQAIANQYLQLYEEVQSRCAR